MEEIILSIVQGITELLPVSSSAHLILTAKLLDFEVNQNYLVALHVGSFAAIAWYYRHQILSYDIPIFTKMLISTIPAGILGLLFDDMISSYFYDIKIIAFMLFSVGVGMIFLKNRKTTKTIESLSYFDALLIGFGQSIALIPGTSRSAITTITGDLVGLSKDKALEYAFIIGIPVIMGSFFLELIFEYEKIEPYLNTQQFLIPTLITFTVSFLALKIMHNLPKEHFFHIFGVYRIVIAAIILIV